MSAQVQNEFITFIAGEALEAYRRVTLDASGQAIYADNEAWIGVTQAPAASGAVVNVRSRYAPGTFLIAASEAISAHAAVTTAADGKVAASGGLTVGIAREAASADGNIIEVVLTSQSTTPGAASVGTAELANAVADQIFATTVAIANTGTPDGVAHVTGQVQDAQGNSLTGRFIVRVYFDDTSYGDPEDLGTLTAATNSRLLKETTDDAFADVLTHSDGSWGVDLDTTADGTVHVHASVVGKFATASASITGN